MRHGNEIGLVFGRLTVLEKIPGDRSVPARFRCRCSCGAEKLIRAKPVRRGSTKSCGCLNRELASARMMGKPARPGSGRPPKPIADRFWPFVDKRGADECWLWTGANANGYGAIWGSERSRAKRAHRVAYELLVGPIPDGLTLDHLCRNTRCVNPKHLEPCTAAENARRASVSRMAER